MKFFELISLNSGIMKILHKNRIKIDAYRHLELYEKYLKLSEKGEKMTYIVADLSASFDMCERSVYKIIEFFETNVTV